MPLPGSGAISLGDIQTEFGGSNPIGLDEYYRGGSFVSSSLTAVPSSGTISLNQFYGLSAADAIPDAVNWANLTTAGTTTQTITGITQAITLRFEVTSAGSITQSTNFFDSYVSVSILVNGVSQGQVYSLAPGGNNGGLYLDVSVTNGQTVTVELDGSPGSGSTITQASTTISVKNASSSFTTLDTFTVSGSFN